MVKTKSFTVYLLKDGFDATNALVDDHSLEQVNDAANVSEEDTLYLLPPNAKPPWWKTFFGVQRNLDQALAGAILFHAYEDHTFLFTFGNVKSKIRKEAYKHDFGRIISLNLVDPAKLKSTDTLSPTVSQRRRTQMPVDTVLGDFDFDSETTILRGLTGKAPEEYKGIISTVTGSDSVKIRSPYQMGELDDLCDLMLELYGSEKYKEVFPDVENVEPVRAPDLISQLDNIVMLKINAQDTELQITYPDIVNFKDDLFIKFRGAGKVSSSTMYPYRTSTTTSLVGVLSWRT